MRNYRNQQIPVSDINQQFNPQINHTQGNEKHAKIKNPAGGFKILDDQLNKKRPKVIGESYKKDIEYTQQDIYNLLEIENNENNDLTSNYFSKRIGIQDKFLHSTEHRPIKNQFSDQLLLELEIEKEKVRQRRQNLVDKSIQNPDPKYNKLFQNVPEALKYKERGVDEILENVQNIDDIENQLFQHRQKMKELGKKYEELKGVKQDNKPDKNNEMLDQLLYSSNYEAKNIVDAVHRDNPSYVQGIHTRLLEYGGYTPVDNGSQSLIRTTKIQDQYRKEKIIEQEMELVKQKKMKEMEKETITQIYPAKIDYTDKFQTYLIDKQVLEILETKTAQKEEFDQYKQPNKQKSEKKIKKQELMDIPLPRNTEEQFQYEVEQGVKMCQIKDKEEFIKIHLQQLVDKIIFDKLQSDKVTVKNEEFLLKYTFTQIDKNKAGIISSQELFDYLSINQKPLQYFQLQIQNIYTDIMNFKTSRIGLFDLADMTNFFKTEKKITKPQQNYQELDKCFQTKQESLPVPVYEVDKLEFTDGTCVLNEKSLDKLRILYADLDKYDDYIIDRLKYLQFIRKDSLIQQSMKHPAVAIPIINKVYTLEFILNFIEEDYHNAQEKSAVEYISWNQFYDYFKNFKNKTIQNIKLTKEQQIFDIDADSFSILKDIFDMIPRVQGDYANVTEWVLYCKNDPQVQDIKKILSRLTSDETNLDEENVEQTLDRLIYEADQNSTWEELKYFFSRRGRPAQLENFEADRRKLQIHGDENKKQLNVNKNEMEALNQEEEDQKDQNFEILKNFDYKQFDIKQIQTMKQTIKNNQDVENKTFTVPLPFQFEDKQKKLNIREQKVEQMIKEIRDEEENALNTKFKANDVPITSKIPLYHNIVKSKEEKREHDKDYFANTLMTTEKPFSFYQKDKQLKKQKKQQLAETVQKELEYQKKQTKFRAQSSNMANKNMLFSDFQKQKKEQQKTRIEQSKKQSQEEMKKLQPIFPNTFKAEKEYREMMKIRLASKTHEQIVHCKFTPEPCQKVPSEIKEALETRKKEKEEKAKQDKELADQEKTKQPKPKQADFSYLNDDNKKLKATLDRKQQSQLVKNITKEMEEENLEKLKKIDDPLYVPDPKLIEKKRLKELESKFDKIKNNKTYINPKGEQEQTMTIIEIQDMRKLREQQDLEEKMKPKPVITKTLDELEEKFRQIQSGQKYINKKEKNKVEDMMTIEEIKYMNKLSDEKKVLEISNKIEKSLQKEKQIKDNAKLVNNKNLEAEMKNKKEIEMERERKIQEQPLLMDKSKVHGSSLMNNLRAKQNVEENNKED